MAIPNTPHMPNLLERIDGERTIGEILDVVQRESQTAWDKPSRVDLFREFATLYQSCSDLEWMRLRHNSVPAYPGYRAFQEPVTENYRVADEAMSG